MARSPLSFVRRDFADLLLRRGGASVSARDEGDRERSGCEAAKERRGATSHRLPSAMVADALSVVLEPRAGEGRCERKSANEALREARARYDGARYARFHTSEWHLCTHIPVEKEFAEGGSYRLIPMYDENGRFFLGGSARLLRAGWRWSSRRSRLFRSVWRISPLRYMARVCCRICTCRASWTEGILGACGIR